MNLPFRLSWWISRNDKAHDLTKKFHSAWQQIAASDEGIWLKKNLLKSSILQDRLNL